MASVSASKLPYTDYNHGSLYDERSLLSACNSAFASSEDFALWKEDALAYNQRGGTLTSYEILSSAIRHGNLPAVQFLVDTFNYDLSKKFPYKGAVESWGFYDDEKPDPTNALDHLIGWGRSDQLDYELFLGYFCEKKVVPTVCPKWDIFPQLAKAIGLVQDLAYQAEVLTFLAENFHGLEESDLVPFLPIYEERKGQISQEACNFFEGIKIYDTTKRVIPTTYPPDCNLRLLIIAISRVKDLGYQSEMLTFLAEEYPSENKSGLAYALDIYEKCKGHLSEDTRCFFDKVSRDYSGPEY